MKPNSRNLLFALGTALAVTSTQAAEYTYTVPSGPATTSDPWSTDTKWDVTPISDPATSLVFTLQASGNSQIQTTDSINDIADPFQLNELTFNSNPSAGFGSSIVALNISGNPLEFVSNGPTAPVINLDGDRSNGQQVRFSVANDVVLSADTLFTGDGTASYTFSGNISGAGTLTKSGSSTLTLSGTNTFSGGITIDGGEVFISSDSNLGAATNDITFSGVGSALRLDNTNFTLGAGRTITAEAGVIGVIAKARINGNRTLGIDGQLTGEGGFHLSAEYQLGNYVVNANNLNNDFQGVLRLGGNNSGDYQFTPGIFTFNTASLADDTGYGNIQFGRTRGAATDANVFAYTNAATSDLVLNNRRIELDSNGSQAIIRNNSTTQAIIINTDTLVSRNENQKLVLDAATGSTNNEFGGVIANGSFNSSTQIVSLDKTGNGAWTLGGANTYTGDTFVDVGTLNLANNAELLFVIGALGQNNAILGDASNATLNLNGILAFNLAGASTTAGDFWNIVDVDNLDETYGSTFSLSSTVNGSFSENSGLWTISENGTSYSFEESTGILTVVPEPSAALLGGLGCLLLLRRRRA